MSTNAHARLSADQQSVEVRVTEKVHTPKGNEHTFACNHTLDLKAAEKLHYELGSCVDTLRGIQKPLRRRVRLSQAFRALKGK